MKRKDKIIHKGDDTMTAVNKNHVYSVTVTGGKDKKENVLPKEVLKEASKVLSKYTKK
ncbi:MAG: hypothetical protein RR728_10995 [Oscillospiraceae bacterium]